jgi:hypothetical protein
MLELRDKHLMCMICISSSEDTLGWGQSIEKGVQCPCCATDKHKKVTSLVFPKTVAPSFRVAW